MLLEHDRPTGSCQTFSRSDEASTSQSCADDCGPTRRPSRLANEDIELSRRAIPVQSVEPDVCSICLDSFTDDDPGKFTACGYVPAFAQDTRHISLPTLPAAGAIEQSAGIRREASECIPHATAGTHITYNASCSGRSEVESVRSASNRSSCR